MHRVRMLQHFGVTPFLVFDGDYLPSKAATEADRSKRREESKKLGMELLNAGKTSQAYLELQKAVDVTPEMARQLIDELKATGVQYIVAPYEADAQMVYLERKGVIQGILSEDSDLLVFGAKCLLTKLDQYGNCIEINKADFCACREINLTGWSDTEFRRMAILSGCDYLASINNMGLKTAYRMVRKHKTIEKVLRMLSFDGKYHVPSGYLEAFYQAELTFLHQRVFCPLSNKMVYHTEPENPLDDEKMSFIGAYVEPAIAMQVAIGDLNPMTKKPIVVKESHDSLTGRSHWGAPRPKLQRAVTADDLKKGVSIEQFFKPKRIPLAEMDPNCFTPSPSQQNALLRNSGSWGMSPVLPRPYLERSSTASETQLSNSAPPVSRSQVGRTLPWSTSVSASRPPKRARLCEENTTVGTRFEYESATLGRSPFFGSATTDASPSIGRSKDTRSKKDDSYLYSDDSIEEAMLNLPDYDGWQKPKGRATKIAIFEEVHEDTGRTLDAMSNEVSKSQSAEGATFSGATVPSLTQGTSTASSIEAPPTPVQCTVPTTLEGLKSKFAFTPAATPVQKAVADPPTPPYSLKPSRIPVPTKTSSAASKTSLATKSTTKSNIMTPLQNLGVKALNRFKVPATPPYTPTATSNRSHIASKKNKASVPFPEVTHPSTLKTSIDPADIPLPAADYIEEVILAMDVENIDSKGSEDLIVHDSQDEEDNEDSSPVDFKTSGLLLSSYAFVA